jgi:hypothetical protein
MTLNMFRKRVETYIEAHGLAPTAFGKFFAGDPNFVADLRAGREPRQATQRKVLDAMKAKR